MTENKSADVATLEILQKYSRLLNNAPETRSALAQDEDLAVFLLKTLAKAEDQKIIRISLEILWDLISCAGNKTKLVLLSYPNSKNVLINLLDKFKCDTTIAFLCESIVDALFPGYRSNSNTYSNTTNRSRASRFLAGSRQQSKTLVFQADTFSQPDVKLAVEKSLINIKGVISIYFDRSPTARIWRCIIRVSMIITAQTIIDAILATDRVPIVYYMTKDEFGEEVTILYEKSEKPDEKKMERIGKSSPLPSYLDEDEGCVVIGDRALAVFGEKESAKKSGGGWLSGVSSFFTKTLYW